MAHASQMTVRLCHVIPILSVSASNRPQFWRHAWPHYKLNKGSRATSPTCLHCLQSRSPSGDPSDEHTLITMITPLDMIVLFYHH